jgi:hypothetical protein
MISAQTNEWRNEIRGKCVYELQSEWERACKHTFSCIPAYSGRCQGKYEECIRKYGEQNKRSREPREWSHEGCDSSDLAEWRDETR